MTQDTKSEQEKPVLFGKGTIAVIAGIVIILGAFLAVNMMQGGQETVVPPAACGEKAIAYVNNNLVQPGTSARLLSTTESRGLYELEFLYQSQVNTMYMTKDCTLLFTDTVNITAPVTVKPTQQATAAPVKSARPTVDLYVMSFCPYGTQAEAGMSPVVDLLKAKADIRIRFIARITGSTVDSVNSLHGSAEAQEDLQQICINKYYPEKFWAYLTAFNDNCYPSWRNATVLESCRKNTTAALSIDSAKINTCAQGAEGLALLKADETASAKDHATASPMLFINGVQYSGARTPDAYKQAICNSFETAPAECGTVLSSGTTASTGNC
jgi:glutaredoxin